MNFRVHLQFEFQQLGLEDLLKGMLSIDYVIIMSHYLWRHL